MQESIKEYLKQAKVGRKQVYKNMALFPLLPDYSLSLDYILLDEALGGRGDRGDGGERSRSGAES